MTKTRELLLSIQPQHLVNILNGKKTIELRKKFPSDFRGWVYLYCTKAKPKWLLSISEKVVCRFWVDNVEEIDTNLGHPSIYVKACVQDQEAIEYGKGKTVKAISISKLEIFDTPKELSDFYYFRTATVYCGMDCPPYVDEVKYTLRKAPKNFRYVYVKGEE